MKGLPERHFWPKSWCTNWMEEEQDTMLIVQTMHNNVILSSKKTDHISIVFFPDIFLGLDSYEIIQLVKLMLVLK